MTDRATESSARGERLPTISRRGLLTALGGAAAAAAGYGYGLGSEGRLSLDDAAGSDDSPASPADVETLTALATAILPSSFDVDESWVENRVLGRVEPKPGHFERLVAAIEAVDSHAKARFGAPVTSLPSSQRRGVLVSMGVTEVHPTADGTTAERVRFHLVNDLLYAMLTSPESSDLTGIANPPGYPGGTSVYTQGPGGERQ